MYILYVAVAVGLLVGIFLFLLPSPEDRLYGLYRYFRILLFDKKIPARQRDYAYVVSYNTVFVVIL
jgi:hypothetical protein